MTSPGKINIDNKHFSSPLTTLFRKASAHKPSGKSTLERPTHQPQSPLIRARFRGSVATASSYDTNRFQDEESVPVDIRTSDSTVRAFHSSSTHTSSFRAAPRSSTTARWALEPPYDHLSAVTLQRTGDVRIPLRVCPSHSDASSHA